MPEKLKVAMKFPDLILIPSPKEMKTSWQKKETKKNPQQHNQTIWDCSIFIQPVSVHLHNSETRPTPPAIASVRCKI